MGMAASQARFLQITARMSNIEYESQQICQARLSLADKTQAAATNYQAAMTNRVILFDPLGQTYNTNNDYERFTYDDIVNSAENAGLGMRLVDSLGRVIVPNLPSNVTAGSVESLNYLVDENVLDANYLETGLREKGWNLQQVASYATTTQQGWSESDLMEQLSTAQENGEDTKSIMQKIMAFLNKIFGNSNSEEQNARIVDSYGREIVTELPEGVAGTPQAANYRVVDKSVTESDYIYEMIEKGEWKLEEIGEVETKTATSWSTTSWASTTGVFDVLDTSDDGEAEATYTALTAQYQEEDKELELREQQLNSEHSALQTEYDAVKKVIDKNVETTFKTFG